MLGLWFASVLVLVKFRVGLGKVKVDYFGSELGLLYCCIKANDTPNDTIEL